MRLRCFVALSACAVILVGCGTTTEAAVVPQKVAASNDLVRWFAEQHADCEIVASAFGDVTDDGTKDLVVVYADVDGAMHTRVVVGGDAPAETNDVPAPVEDQRISFRDIDKKAPVEFIVRGSKGADIGFAIYRVEGTTLSDLFGDNMDRCCDGGDTPRRLRSA